MPLPIALSISERVTPAAPLAVIASASKTETGEIIVFLLSETVFLKSSSEKSAAAPIKSVPNSPASAACAVTDFIKSTAAIRPAQALKTTAHRTITAHKKMKFLFTLRKL